MRKIILCFLSIFIVLSYGRLIAYYNFEEGTGDQFLDKSGNGNHATIYNLTAIPHASPNPSGWGEPGKYGKSFFFDGQKYAMMNPIIGKDDFSVVLWIKTSMIQGSQSNGCWYQGYGIIDCEVVGRQPGKADWGLSITNGRFLYGLGLINPYSDQCAGSPVGTFFNSNTWQPVAITRSKSLGVFTLSVANARTGITTYSWSTINKDDLTSAERIVMGMIQTNNNYYIGYMDEVKIYNHALTSREINDIFTLKCIANIDCPVNYICKSESVDGNAICINPEDYPCYLTCPDETVPDFTCSFCVIKNRDDGTVRLSTYVSKFSNELSTANYLADRSFLGAANEYKVALGGQLNFPRISVRDTTLYSKVSLTSTTPTRVQSIASNLQGYNSNSLMTFKFKYDRDDLTWTTVYRNDTEEMELSFW